MSSVACDWLTLWFYVADELIFVQNNVFFEEINVKKCIRMGVTIFKIFI